MCAGNFSALTAPQCDKPIRLFLLAAEKSAGHTVLTCDYAFVEAVLEAVGYAICGVGGSTVIVLT